MRLLFAVSMAALSLALPSLAHADEIATPEVVDVAAEAGVDPMDLQGAVNTTRLEPRAYLVAVGELGPPPAPEPAVGLWDALAQCESGGNWSANTGNGFYGGIQFDYDSWLKAGGGKYARTANKATRAQQIEIGKIWLSRTSWAHSWPACSRRLGLRP
jgi:hypothetical protein